MEDEETIKYRIHTTHYHEILKFASNNQRDLKIIGKNGESVESSSLLLLLYSDYIEKLLAMSVEPPWLIHLEDFDISVIKILMDFLSMECKFVHYDFNIKQLSQLVKILHIKINFNKLGYNDFKTEINDIMNHINTDDDEEKDDVRKFNYLSDYEEEDKGFDEEKKVVANKKKKLGNGENKRSKAEWNCDQCGETLRNKILFHQHFKIRHPGIKAFFCLYCDKRFNVKDKLLYHIETKHNDPVNTPRIKRNCKLCDMIFDNVKDYKAHRKEFHPDKPREKPEKCTCEICGKIVSCKYVLINHMKIHSNDRNFVCDLCGKKFIVLMDLKRHKENQHEKPGFTCYVCDKKFGTMFEMLRHRKEHANEEANHVCSICGNRFHSPKILKNHIYSHKAKIKKSYSCKLCGKIYGYSSGIEQHIIYHHRDDSPFACMICDVTGRNRMYVRRHIDSHHSNEELSKQRVLFKPSANLSQFLKENIVKSEEQLNGSNQ